eukprot:GHUV01007791.1.p1 GENE.GHUV01007791.1~~GHUV01007791.1.p1  ORF type:complete len:1062 (+),score=409.26 GHUV01007791.1:105-3290(+)
MKRQRDDPPQPGMIKRQAGVQRGPPPGNINPGAVHRLTTNDALTYLREVKNRFADKKDVYDTFLEIMKEFKAQRIDTAGVIMRVKELFRGHKELVLGFNTFLPKGYEIQLADVADMDDEPPAQQMVNKQPVEFDQAINYVNKIKTRFAQDERVYKAFLEILNMYRKGQKTITQVYDEVAVLFRSHSDLLTEFTYFLPDNSPPQGGHPLFRNLPGARQNMAGYGRPQPAMGPGNRVMQGGPNRGYGAGGYGAGGGGGLNKRKGMRPGDMGGNDDYMGSGRFGGPLDREMQFFEKVKARLRNRELYQDFLKCLNLYAQEIISRQELLNLAHDIIGRYPDLLDGFQRFLQRCETMDAVDSEMRSQFGAGKISAKDMARLKGQSVRDKMLSKPISEVAAEYNPDDRCTPSYVRIPASYPKLKSTGRTALGEEVLNDSWVSIISGSEDYSFKLMRKNQYEEALFRCEDDRFELDMCIETNNSTLNKLRPLREQFMTMSPEDKALYRLPGDALGAIHFRAVERIYGDQGPQIVELMKKNPTVAIPVIIVRLEQKAQEWLKVREEMNKLWRKVFEQNYHKSLDHRSFYFKQSDKKGLMPKAMLQEVRDAAEKRRMDERQLQCLATGSPNSIMVQPDLLFDYNSDIVFDDLYQAVVYGIEEQLTGDVREAVLTFWHTMVEPFFGRGQRQYQQLHTKIELQQLEAEEHAEKASSSDDEGDEKTGKGDDGAESGGVTGTDAAGQTPEPGTTPEPEDKDDKGDALAALLAAGAGDMSEHEGDMVKKSDLRDMSVDRSKRDDSEGEPDRYYHVCKPLNTRANAAAAASDVQPDFDWRKQHVLYGNDNHYFFFRLHRHVFDRLAAAQRCAREKNQPQFRQTGDEHIIRRMEDPQAEAARAEEAQRLHREFMSMLRKVLDGHMDSSTFEDQCRALLGTNSYVLFTLDKLIQKFIKHMASMVQEEQAMRLCDLHKYESARRLPICDEVYRANANILLHDEPCYRFAFVEGITSGAEVGNDHAQFTTSSSSLVKQEAAADGRPAVIEGGQLQLQLLDPDKSEQQPLGLDSSFQEYIK